MMEANDTLDKMDAVVEKLLSNVPTPDIVAAAKEDFLTLVDYSHAVDTMWAVVEQFNPGAVNKQLDMLAALTAAYTMGYRKGRASTPLTLVVAPEEQE